MKKATVNYYLRLQFHRVTISEGIRLAARRNNNHMFRIQSKIGPTMTPGSLGYAQIQNAILEDQRVERNRVNRAVLGFATWTPWEIYLSLLSEQLRAYKQAAQTEVVPRSEALDGFLEDNSTITSRLGSFRNKVLHPESGQSSGQLYPYHFDDLIKLYYRHGDAIVEAQYLLDMHLATLELRLAKLEKTKKLTGLLLPAINDWQDRGEIHTALPSRMIWPCLETLAAVVQHDEGNSRDSKFTTYAKVGYLMMLVRFSVLVNETLHQLYFMGKSDEELEQQIEYVSAPMIVALTLLHPGLRKYGELTRTRPELRDDVLQEFTGDQEFIDVLTTLRNAVFHVSTRSTDIELLSQRVLDLAKRHTKWEDVSFGLLRFFQAVFEMEG